MCEHCLDTGEVPVRAYNGVIVDVEPCPECGEPYKHPHRRAFEEDMRELIADVAIERERERKAFGEAV
jgi:hypothetical protein